jgi:FkbM family methyltransferase
MKPKANLSNRITTIVIDTGGRYGLHPTWKPFKGELAYHLFEPDVKEAERLKKKYSHRSDVIVQSLGLLDSKGVFQLNILQNPAMSTCCQRQSVSPLFWTERKDQTQVISGNQVECTTIDAYCEEKGIRADFLKLDTEGSEQRILLGASKQLDKNVLGVRCEVGFDEVFEGGALFCEVHTFLRSKGFFLVNLDYNGKGDFLNEFVQASGRYGILISCDGLWLKRPRLLFNSARSMTEKAIQVLKYAMFCLNNNAPDLAIHTILEARKEHGLSFSQLEDSHLLRQVELNTHRHFYALKWQPGQSLERHYEIYERMFGKRMLRVQEYNESMELNPE